jgi:DNA-binding GntR family transcriptional regulator
MQKVIEDHQAVLDGIVAGNAERAVAAMIEHLNGVLPEDIEHHQEDRLDPAAERHDSVPTAAGDLSREET